MERPSQYYVIFTACGSKEEAEKLARLLVEGGLAACVQLTAITSFYRWKGKLNRDVEELLLIKARGERYEEIQKAILENHSYELPEIIAVPVQKGLERYFAWIDEMSG